jgi:uncharacterized protein YjbI with pentapeptide repeats
MLFSSCQLQYVDFHRSEFSKVEFKDTDIAQSQFYNTKLKGIDFTSCNIDGLAAGIEDVNGAIISHAQAISLITLLGVVLK